MLEQLEHMKRWALQDQSALSKEQICQSFAAMCDDAIAELQAAQPVNAPDATIAEREASLSCPHCGKLVEVVSRFSLRG